MTQLDADSTCKRALTSFSAECEVNFLRRVFAYLGVKSN